MQKVTELSVIEFVFKTDHRVFGDHMFADDRFGDRVFGLLLRNSIE